MRGNELLDKMELVDPALVEAAEGASVPEMQGRAKSSGADEVPAYGIRRWTKWAAAAACLCLLAVGGFMAVRHGIFLTGQEPGDDIGSAQGESGDKLPDSQGNDDSEMDLPEEDRKIIVSENGVTIPPMKVSLRKDEGACIATQFFIYQGRCYMENSATAYIRTLFDLDDVEKELLGEHLGTVTGMIDEWTPKDGYVEFAGSIYGEIYTLKGYDPSFMLGVMEGPRLRFYVCNNGITLKYGSDFLEDRLHLAGNYCALMYEDKGWDREYEILPLPVDVEAPAVSELVEAMDRAEFVTKEQELEKEEGIGWFDVESYRLEFVKNDGVRFDVFLYENGRVWFSEFNDICIRIPQETYDAFAALVAAD